LPALDEGLKRGLESEAGRRGPHIAALWSVGTDSTDLHVDLAAASESAAAQQAYEWLQCVDRPTLNVAGPRASQDPAIYRTSLSSCAQRWRSWRVKVPQLVAREAASLAA